MLFFGVCTGEKRVRIHKLIPFHAPELVQHV